MKTLFIALTFSAFSALAQGRIEFANFGFDIETGAHFRSQVVLPDGEYAAGARFTAGLFLLSNDTLKLVATTWFQTGGQFYAGEVEVPGTTPLQVVPFRVRVWESAAGSYEAAVANGLLFGEFSTGKPDNLLFVKLGPVGAGNLAQVPNLYGIEPLTLIPEPSPTLLLILAATGCGLLKTARFMKMRAPLG